MYSKNIFPIIMTLGLDLGCGSNPKNYFNASSFFGVDLEPSNDSILKVDLRCEPLPFPDRCIDFLTAFDVIEHLPRTFYDMANKQNINSFIFFMNECSRVLREGGLFYHSTPIFPSEDAFIDPTHCNFLTRHSMIYFASVPSHLKELVKSYGITTRFEIKESKINGSHLQELLIKT